MSTSVAASGALGDRPLLTPADYLDRLRAPKSKATKTLRPIFTANEIRCDEDHDFLCEALVPSWAN